MTFSKYYDHTYHIFKDLKILSIPKLYYFKVATFVVKYKKDILPSIFNHYLEFNVTQYNTRQKHLLKLPKFKKYKTVRTLKYSAIKIFNFLNSKIQIDCSKSVNCLKCTIKHYLISNDLSIKIV